MGRDIIRIGFFIVNIIFMSGYLGLEVFDIYYCLDSIILFFYGLNCFVFLVYWLLFGVVVYIIFNINCFLLLCMFINMEIDGV